jgi:hypothetical protein
MYYLRYLCLLAYSGVFVCLSHVSCVLNVARFSGFLKPLSMFSNVY